MAEPATIIGGLSLGTSILGGVLGARSAKAAGNSAFQMGLYQAGIAKQNAEYARQNADIASVEGEQSAMKYGMKARQQAGDIAAAQGASGLDVNSGSAKDVRESQHLVSTMDMDQIRRNAAKAAFDYRVTAANYEQEAMMSLMGAQNAKSAANTNALSSIIGSASSVADKWLRGKEVGMWGV